MGLGSKRGHVVLKESNDFRARLDLAPPEEENGPSMVFPQRPG